MLITGGTGTLGRALVEPLRARGYAVRVMSRRPRPEGLAEGVRWVQADLRTGHGLLRALEGVETIIHAASSPRRHTREVDVGGTAGLLEHAGGTGVKHLIYPSIIGIDRIPFPYYRHKLEAERIIAEGDVPWSILRISQFHPFIEGFIRTLARLSVIVLPLDFKLQPVDVGESAERLVEAIKAGPEGRLRPFAGPEVLTLKDMVATWLELQGKRRAIVHLPLPGRLAEGFRRGYNTAPEAERGSVSWSAWLRRKLQRERVWRVS